MNRFAPSLVLGAMAALSSLNIGDGKAATVPDVEPLPVEEALRMRRFGVGIPIALSSNGHWLAYITQDNHRMKSTDPDASRQTGVPFWGVGTDIWMRNLLTGETKNLTSGQGDNWLPAWSRDDRYLAFLSNRDGSGYARVWVLELETGELRRVSEISVIGHEIEWTRDSRSLLITTAPGQVSVIPGVTAPLSKMKPGDSLSGSTVLLYKGNDSSESTKDKQKSDPRDLSEDSRDLVAIDLASGSATPIVRNKRIFWYVLSPDGQHLAYTAPQRFERSGSQQLVFDLVSTHLTTAQARVLASGIRLDYDGAAFSWSPDSRRISFHAGGMDERNYDCYVVSLADGVPRNVSNLPALRIVPRQKSDVPAWDRTGEAVFFRREGAVWRASATGSIAERLGSIPDRQVTQIISSPANVLWTPSGIDSAIVLTHDDREKQDGIYQINLSNGRSTKLLENGQCYTCSHSFRPFTVTVDGQHVFYFAEDAQHYESLRISDATFRSSAVLVELNEQISSYKTGAVRLLKWLSSDGEELHGALLLPANYKEGSRYPLIVWVYGGTLLSNNLDHFGLASEGPFNMQLLATRGYAVLLPDAPLHLGTPMLDLAKTVLPGVDKAIELGIADRDRLGIMGHSYGGYSTLALIAETTRFRAAIEISGFGNLLGLYGGMNRNGATFGIPVAELGQVLMGGTPWEFRSRYIENSPVFNLDKIETPLLIVHGSNDTFVPPFLADEVFVGLRRLGKEVEYANYQGEAHSPLDWSFQNQMDFCHRMLAWFDLHLRCARSKGAAPLASPTE